MCSIQDYVCQWLAAGRWFSPGTLVSSTNKIDRHVIIEIVLKVALYTITLTLQQYPFFLWQSKLMPIIPSKCRLFTSDILLVCNLVVVMNIV
jgi:hypothetical protein